jgi:hypothetical protein
MPSFVFYHFLPLLFYFHTPALLLSSGWGLYAKKWGKIMENVMVSEARPSQYFTNCVLQSAFVIMDRNQIDMDSRVRLSYHNSITKFLFKPKGGTDEKIVPSGSPPADFSLHLAVGI